MDGRTTRGSIDDYWISYGSTASDPYLTGGWTQHTYGDAIGDYMRTSQSAYSNTDGSTSFFTYNTLGDQLTCDTMASNNLKDGTLGMRQFYQKRGYTVTQCYNQKTDNEISGGFSLNDYKNEITNGHPVILNLFTSGVGGHTIVGVGFDSATNKVIVHDTWDYSNHTMTWGGSYGGMQLRSVSVINLASATVPAVTLNTPFDKEINANLQQIFTWQGVSGISQYSIQVSADTNFTDPAAYLVNETVTNATSYAMTSNLPGDGTYYWRVRAIDDSGSTGAWSKRSFTVDTLPPSPPVLSSPADAATPVGIPSFTWLAAATANAYQFKIDDSADLNSPVDITPDGSNGTPLAVLTYKPDASHVSYGVVYYWAVRARDAAGNWSDWSTPRTVNIQASLPVAPVLTSPATGTLTNTQPALAWNSVSGGVRYQVQIANNAGFTGTLFEDKTLDLGVLTYTIEKALTDGVWYWRVRAWNSTGGAGAWSTARSFTFDKTAPGIPVLTSPAANDIWHATSYFTWTVPTTSTAFLFEYGTTTDGTISTFTSVYLSPVLTTAKYTPPAMPIGGFFWHVKASDAAGNWSDWSDLRKININAPYLAAPVPLTPATGILVKDAALTFTWLPVTGAKSYEIQFADTTGFLNTDSDTHSVTIIAGSETYTIGDPDKYHDGIWYWRLRTINATDEAGTTWSTARAFTLDTTAPAAPVLSVPADNAAGIRATPTFSWLASVGANAYQFRISDDSGFGSTFDISPDGTSAAPGTP
ncbi:C39 family peptidase, partial [Leptolinea tardivitalis]|uniref:C39 family peptidase n=1 Tax=Leptolinea tardivitalis TaxID=229920 RepID=UPI000B15D47A